jgi:Fic family protein
MCELRERLGGLPSQSRAAAAWRELWLEDAHHSVAIEGRASALALVERRLAGGLPVATDDLRAHLRVSGYASAASWVYRHAGEGAPRPDICVRSILHVHSLATGPGWALEPLANPDPGDLPGSFRARELLPFAGGMQPSPSAEVPRLVSEWVVDTGSLRSVAPERLADSLAGLCWRFQWIHPFIDGNGRTGRLLLGLMLIGLELPPAILFRGDRSLYIAALRSAGAGDTSLLGELIARGVLHSLRRLSAGAGADRRPLALSSTTRSGAVARC